LIQRLSSESKAPIIGLMLRSRQRLSPVTIAILVVECTR
jgi:hypothetical protein